MRLLAVLIIFVCSPSSFAKKSVTRDFQILMGFGIGASFAKLSSDTSTANFSGYTPALEFGLEIPFSEKLGAVLSGTLSQFDLTNSDRDFEYIEKASGPSNAGRLGFYYGALVLGGGYGNDKLSITQVSTTTGASTTELSGFSPIYFANYSLDVSKNTRLSFELQHRNGTLGSFGFSETAGAMKFYFLLGL